MREDEKRVAPLIRLVEQEHEAGDASAGDRTHDQGQSGQEREAPALPFAFAPSLQFRNHALRRFRLPEGESERVRNRRPRLLRLGAFVSWPAASRSIRNGMFEPIPDRAGAWSLPERLFRTAVVGAAENPTAPCAEYPTRGLFADFGRKGRKNSPELSDPAVRRVLARFARMPHADFCGRKQRSFERSPITL